jgi:hypothetical protein
MQPATTAKGKQRVLREGCLPFADFVDPSCRPLWNKEFSLKTKLSGTTLRDFSHQPEKPKISWLALLISQLILDSTSNQFDNPLRQCNVGCWDDRHT